MASLVQPCSGPNGNGVTNANASGGNQFNSVTTTGAGTTQTWDNGQVIHGNTTSLLRSVIANVASTCYEEWSTLPVTPVANAYARFYAYFTAVPTVNTRQFAFIGGGVLRTSFIFTTTGFFRTLDTSGGTIATTTESVPLNQWIRVEFEITGISGTNGNVALRIYSGQNLESITPDAGGSLFNASTNIAGTVDDVRIGHSSSVTETVTWTSRYSDIAYSDTAQPGPYGGYPQALPAAVGQTWRRAFKHRQQPPGAASGPVTNQLTLSASVTAAGAQSVQAGKILAVTVTVTGTVARRIGRLLAGAVTAVATAIRQVGKPLTGSSAASGAMSVQVGKQLAGAVTAAGTIARQVGKVITGTVTATGAVIRQVGKTAAGAATAAGTLARQVGKQLPGGATAAGAQSVQVGKPLTAAATASGSVIRQVGRVLAATATATGAVAVSHAFLLTLTATVTAAGKITRGIGKILAGAVSAVASLLLPTPPPHVSRAQVTITPAGPLAAQVAITRIIPSTAVAITPAGAGVATVAVTAAIEAAVAITPAGAGAASVTITLP